MTENREEQSENELEEDLLSPLQEPFPLADLTAQGEIVADEINAVNVVSGTQYVHKQVFNVIDEGLSAGIAQRFRSKKSATSSKAPPFILPQLDIPYFTGREGELKQLEQLLLHPGGPRIAGIVGLTGTGGMGKSALAFHFATVYRDQFPDGVIGLRVNEMQVDSLAQRFAYLANVEIDPRLGLTAADIMQRAFGDKRALLIFDNADEATARALNPGGDRCAVIVTTRNRGLLNSFGIPADAQIDVQRFTYQETEKLFRQMLGDERVTSELEAVEEIHTLVGGLPLALRIVGSALAEEPFTIKRYAEVLRDEKERLHLRDPHIPELDVYASFTISLGFLNEEQQALFACLGACAPEGFSLQAVRAASQLDEIATGRALGRLVRLSLLNEAIQKVRFVLHPLLFLFSRELAQERSLLMAAEQRHTDYYIRYVREHRGLSPANLDALEQELDALLLTARRLTNNGIADYEYYLSLEPFLQASGYWSQALELIDTMLRVAYSLDDYNSIVQLLLQRAQFLQLLARLSEAEQVLQESRNTTLQIENTSQRKRLLAMVLNSLGGIYLRQGKLNEAIDVLQQSATIEEETSHIHGQAKVLNSLGSVYQRQGKFDNAINALQQSYTLLTYLNDEHGRAMVLNSLGGVYQRQGKFEEAADAFQKSRKLLTELGDERGQAMVLNSLGGVYQRQGKFEEAVQAFQQSHAISAKLGDERSLAMVLNSLGGVYQRQGRFEEAVQAFQQSHKLLTELGDERGQAMALNSLGGVYQRQDRLEEAFQAFQQSLDLGKGMETHRAMVLSSWGKALLDHDQPLQAIEKLKASFEIEERLRKTVGLRIVSSSLIRALTQVGQREEARQFIDRALSVDPQDWRLLKLKEQLAQTHPVNLQILRKKGAVKRILHKPAGYLYGFITPDDGSAEVYFGEDQVDAPLLSQLAEGQHVDVEVEMAVRGPRARRVWVNAGN